MKLLYKSKPRTVVLYSDTYSLTFRTSTKQTNAPKPTVNLELVPNSNITPEAGFRTLLRREVYGCLGLIYVDNQIFLSVITGALTNVARPIKDETVDKIYSVDFVSLNNSEWDFVELDSQGYPVVTNDDDDDARYNRVQHPCFEFKKLLSNGSFYYSNDFDLTSTLQTRGVNETLDELNHYSPSYMWNSFLADEMIQFRSNLDSNNRSVLDDNRFLTTVIRGFAKTVPMGRQDSITIISKQSWRRAGTRYNTRGIDDDGNVANFVETEFIYYNPSKKSIFTYTQIRGSVPTFWEQDSTLINPKITLTRSPEATQPMFNKHFAEIGEHYGVCHIVDLLSKTKSSEVQLSNRYKQLYKNCDRREEIEYTAFDFHAETKNAGDRTNLIEQVISRTVFENILKQQTASHGNQGRDHAMIENFIYKHNELWADHGDAISQIYTGTNALKSSFTRSGKMNLAGALSDVTKSVSRMYQNTFIDGKKQSTIDLLLGVGGPQSKKVKIYDPASDYVTAQLEQQSRVFTTDANIKVFTGTYNVNALEPSANIDLTSWLFPPENESMPDIYAIGFQELIELNAGSFLAGDVTKPQKWAAVLNQQLNSQREQYVLLRTESIASMSLFLFVKSSSIQHVTRGACAVRFEYGATSFALITSHLAAGTTAIAERFNDYTTIMQGMVFTRNYSIHDHDHVIWFGDLNYRIDLPNGQCRNLIENGAFDELAKKDQLKLEMRDKGAFSEFNEGAVKFYPTYKFDKGTSNYDSSEKQRVPSWTDRVLYLSLKKKRNDLKQLNYNSVMDVYLSDHKPVYSTFAVKVEFIDKTKKSAMAKDLYDGYRKEHGNSYDLVSLNTLSPTPSTKSVSSSNKNDNFVNDALADLNLLDDFDPHAPSLPARPNFNATAPRRVPPPPASRKTTSTSTSTSVSPPTNQTNASSTQVPRKLPPLQAPLPLNGQSKQQPSTSQSIAQGSPKPMKVPIGFSSSPLIPSRSNSNSPSVSNSPVSTPKQLDNNKVAKPHHHSELKPMVPSKPSSLSSSKLKTAENHDSDEDAGEADAVKSNGTGQSPPPPPPPVSRAMRTMSDWQPLVPK
ncbi:unnamed protein product [Candida parapsilosis]